MRPGYRASIHPAPRMSTMQSIGKYQLMRELGRGATGKVYLADDPFAKRKVAIKVAFPEALKSDEDGALYKSMFLNEAALAGKLNHPHIVQIYDAVVEDKYSYIVMEFVEGGTLEKFCKPEALLETRDVAEISFKCVRLLSVQRCKETSRVMPPASSVSMSDKSSTMVRASFSDMTALRKTDSLPRTIRPAVFSTTTSPARSTLTVSISNSCLCFTYIDEVKFPMSSKCV